jgi:hypothetical protein
MKKENINFTHPNNISGSTVFTQGEVITPLIKMNGRDDFIGKYELIRLDNTNTKEVLLNGVLNQTIQIPTANINTGEYLLRFLFEFDDGKIQIENIRIEIKG